MSDPRTRVLGDICLAQITARMAVTTEQFSLELVKFGKAVSGLKIMVDNLSAATKEKN